MENYRALQANWNSFIFLAGWTIQGRASRILEKIYAFWIIHQIEYFLCFVHIQIIVLNYITKCLYSYWKSFHGLHGFIGQVLWSGLVVHVIPHGRGVFVQGVEAWILPSWQACSDPHGLSNLSGQWKPAISIILGVRHRSKTKNAYHVCNRIQYLFNNWYISQANYYNSLLHWGEI